MESDSDYSDCWVVSSSEDDQDVSSSDDDQDVSSSEDDQEVSPVKPSGLPVLKRGRAPFASRFPQVVPVLTNFIEQNSAEAHTRRRNSTALSNGTTLGEMKAEVERSIPGMSISRTTIHRMLKPARSNSINARRHVATIDARVPPKRNSRTTKHVDTRFTSAFVNYTNELAFLCEDETLALSCDDKNKINVGTMAVSRHFQIKRFFSAMDAPNYPDHDFPYANSKLIPSGYLVLRNKRRSRSASPQRKIEKLRTRHRSESPRKRKNGRVDPSGRERVPWPRSGPLTVYLQASKFHSSTSQSHVNHLLEVVGAEQRPVVTIIADGGPDWTTKSTVNLLNFGRLWRDRDLDALVATTYAPGQSCYNPVERLWAPLSRWLTGVTLPIRLPGEDKPPCQQPHLTKEELVAKEERVFDRAAERCSKYWNGRFYDGHPISTRCVPCKTTVAAYNDHKELKQFVDASARSIGNTPLFLELQKELKFFMEHCVRRTYSIEFYKCKKNSCSHCSDRPIRAVKFFSLLERLGGVIPTPVTDVSRIKGEYFTLKRLLDNPRYVNNKLDYKLPSAKYHQTCRQGCSYVFLSKRDELRHRTLCHSIN